MIIKINLYLSSSRRSYNTSWIDDRLVTGRYIGTDCWITRSNHISQFTTNNNTQYGDMPRCLITRQWSCALVYVACACAYGMRKGLPDMAESHVLLLPVLFCILYSCVSSLWILSGSLRLFILIAVAQRRNPPPPPPISPPGTGELGGDLIISHISEIMLQKIIA